VNDETQTIPLNRRKNDGSAWWMSLFFAIVCTGLLLIGKFDRAQFDALMWEDSIGEWTTFFAFAFAGIIGIVALLRAIWRNSDQVLKANQVWFRLIIGALSVFCLFAAGEEISWGQRIFGFMPPEIFQEMNFQQELNFHNILEHVVSPRTVIAIICFGYGVILPGVATYRRLHRRSSSPHLTELAAPRLSLAPWFFLAGAAHWTGPYWPTRMVSSAEAVEMVMGLLLLADVVEKTTLLGDFSFGGSTWVAGLKPFSILTFVVVLGVVVNPLLERFVFGSDPEKVAQARLELTAIGHDLEDNEGVHADVIRSNDLVDSRIFYGLRSGWLYFGDQSHFRAAIDAQESTDLRRRHAYFLDPWNNAYWIRMRGLEPIFLYSFGPNRRLDTVLDYYGHVPTEDDLKGDDIGVWIDPLRKYREEKAANGK